MPALRRQSSSSLPDNLQNVGLLEERWYHPGCSRQVLSDLSVRENAHAYAIIQRAEALLSGCEDGWFLVRDTSLNTSTLAVSVSFQGKVFHNRIVLDAETGLFVYSPYKKEQFATVVELLNFFTETPPRRRYRLKRLVAIGCCLLMDRCRFIPHLQAEGLYS